MGVHIADVAYFVPAGSELDLQARQRGTSVYLPGKVIPMLPEIISNGLASLQEGKLRYTKSAFIEFDAQGRITHRKFANSAIATTQRLTYEQVAAYFAEPEKYASALQPGVAELLQRMRRLERILRQRRRERGFLELSMPEPQLVLDDQGNATSAHYADNDESHTIIEEFMLTANEAVADYLAKHALAFLRRVHEIPDPRKLRMFARFAQSLDLEVKDEQSRFELQRLLKATMGTPLERAVHFALLRSLKQATYSTVEDGHWAIASDCYCHFTSPIRRYPDLTVHRLLDHLVRHGHAKSDPTAASLLGEHCSFTERRAEKAERELTKLKLLQMLAGQVGREFEVVITSVEEFGFFAQGVAMPVEGLVHMRSLVDDDYRHDAGHHVLVGRRTGKQYRFGDRLWCAIWKVDLDARELDWRIADSPRKSAGAKSPKRTAESKRKSKDSKPKSTKRKRRG